MRLDGDGHFEYASRVTATDEGHAVSYDASYRSVLLVRGERWRVFRYDQTASNA